MTAKMLGVSLQTECLKRIIEQSNVYNIAFTCHTDLNLLIIT